MTTTATEPSCPKCGGRMWDQKNGKFPWKPGTPIWKCRTKECASAGGVIWEPKGGAAPTKPSNEKKPFVSGPHVPGLDPEEWELVEHEAPATSQGMTKGTAVAKQYEATLDWVLKHVTPKLTAADIPVDAAAVNSMVATILIQASK